MRKSPILAAVLLLSACTNSPESRYFTLSTTQPRQAPAQDRPQFHLAMVKLPELYDRPQLVTRSSPQSVEIDEYDRWAEPLERMTARILAQDIALRRPRAAGPVPAGADQPRLQVAVDEFAADRSAGRAVLSGNWKIVENDGTTRGRAFSFSQAVSGGDSAAVAGAMSALLGQLADEIDRE
ncbi:MAG TPA: PqiC family protein [Magnetospirillaceae bacterium]|nr:PqiC family protein [Magnetospirillaceae bacterium]